MTMTKAVVLFRPKLLMVKNSMSRGIVLRRLPFIAIGVLFAVLLYIGTYNVLSYIRGIEMVGEVLSKKLLSMIFFSLTGFLILSNIVTAISSFYLSRDIPFLVSLPLGKKDILFVKTVETVMNSSWMVASFIPPVFLAYGAVYNASFWYYAVTLLCLTAFMLLSSGIGITIAHVLIRIFPAKGVRDILLFIGLMLFVLAYFALQASAPQDISKPDELIETFMAFKADSPLLPGYWITEVIWGAITIGGTGPYTAGVIDPLYLAVLISNSAFFLMAAFLIGQYTPLLLESNRQGRALLYGSGHTPHFGSGRCPLFYKDIKVFIRDKGQWSQMAVIGALVLVYVYNFKSFPMEALMGIAPLIREIIVLINVVMAGLVLSAVSARFLYSAVSLEGQAFWIIKSLPLDMKRFLWSKFIFGFLPLSAATTALVFLTNLVMDIKGILMFASLATVIILSASISGLGTGMGAIYPKFKYENIASVSMSLGGMTFMLLAFALVLITVALEAWPFYLYYMGSQTSLWLPASISVILIVTINFIAFYLPMKMGIKKLRIMD